MSCVNPVGDAVRKTTMQNETQEGQTAVSRVNKWKKQECEGWGLRHGCHEWYSAKYIWEHPLVLEGIHGTGDIVPLEGMTSKARICFLENYLPHCVSSSRWQEWTAWTDPGWEDGLCWFGFWQREKEKAWAAKVSARGVTVTWTPWNTSLSWSAFCHRRLMNPWRGRCAHALPPVKEIPVCAPHALRCK